MSKLSFEQRYIFAERIYVRYAYTYQTLNFTEWINDEPYPPFYQGTYLAVFKAVTHLEVNKGRGHSFIDQMDRYSSDRRVYSSDFVDAVPAYCSGFKSYLGYKLAIVKPLEVATILNKKFSKPDAIDCDYLTEVLAEIRYEVKQGIGYDPGQPGGLDMYFPPGDAIEFNLDSAERWLLKAREATKHVPVPKQQPAKGSAKAKSKMQQNHQRPNTTLQRAQEAEKLYTQAKSYFKKKDYLDWYKEVELSDGNTEYYGYDDFITPYCLKYPTMLGFTFSCIDNLNVAPVLDKHFPNFDKLDHDYLNDALNEIEGIISIYSFSTTSPDGIDYYNGHGNEKHMTDASMRGLNTDNRFAPKIQSNIDRARKWLETALESIAMAPKANQEPIDAKRTQQQPTQSNTPPVMSVQGLNWLGNGADLAELFYRLAKGGFINLNEFRPPNGGNMTSLCKHVCQLFQVGDTPEKNAAAAVALQKALAKFSAEELEPGEVDTEALWRKPIERKPGNAKSARVAATIPKKQM